MARGECANAGRFIDTILVYAGLGWRVFPVKAGKKTPAIVGWQKAASQKSDQLERWFGNGSESNVGVLTGQPSGFFVIDVDPRNGGDVSLDELESRIGRLPETVVQQTAGGGWHYLFRIPSNRDIRSGTLADHPGIDIKGTGGYIVVSPSRIGDRVYCWEDSSRPGMVSIANAPPELLQLIGQGPGNAVAEDVPEVEEGARNTTLASQAGRLRAMGWGYAAIRDGLLGLNQERCKPPLPEAEVAAIARSIARYAPGSLVIDNATRSKAERLKCTDIGNAERLIAYHGEDLRYCPPRDQWLVWDRTRWKPDQNNEITQRAVETVRRIYGEAAAVGDQKERKSHAAHARNSERAERIRAMVWLSRTLPGVPVQPEELDQDPYLINVLNGTLNLRTLDLREHRREDLITRLVSVAYDPNAECPVWDQFLADVFDGDSVMIQYLQRAAGLCLSGETTPRVFFILHGTGHNGKSTLLEAIRDVLAEYAGTIPPSELMQVRRQNHGKASPFLSQLPGKRFVTAMETEENERLAAALVKTMSGGRDVITVRELYGKAFSFRPQFKLWIATNHRPRITDPTSSIWGRIHMVSFRVQIPDPARGEKPDAKGRVKDPELDEKLHAELPGIFAWLAQGWQRYQEHGLDPPPEVLEATRQYREQEDTVGQFIEDVLVFGKDQSATVKELKACLEHWCIPNGESVDWRKAANRLKDQTGAYAGKVRGERGWHGVAPRGGKPSGT